MLLSSALLRSSGKSEYRHPGQICGIFTKWGAPSYWLRNWNDQGAWMMDGWRDRWMDANLGKWLET